MEASEHVDQQNNNKPPEEASEHLRVGVLEDTSNNKQHETTMERSALPQALDMASDQNGAQLDPVKVNEMLSSITTPLSVPGSDTRLAQTAHSHTDRVHSGGFPCLPQSPAMASDVPWDLPPSYTPQPTDGSISVLQSMDMTSPSLPTTELAFHHQDILFYLPHGVQIFFVAPDGQVSAPSYPGHLCITLNSKQCDDDDSTDTRHPLAHLQVCDWQYPLFPDLPVLLSDNGVFTFPDTMAAVPGSCVGVVLPVELPDADRALFHEHLTLFTQLRVKTSAEDNGADEATDRNVNLDAKSLINPTDDSALKKEKIALEWRKISRCITAGALFLNRGLVRGAEATGKAINTSAIKLREHITPEEVPAEVSPRVTTGLYVAQQTAGGAVKVGQFLVNGLSTVVELVGKEITPHVKKHGSKLIPESLKSNEGACANMTGAKEVAVSSLKGLSTIWSGLETAAKTVGKSAKSEIVLTVKHKYGNAASQATDTALQSVTDVGVAALTLDNLGYNVIMKCAGEQISKTSTTEDQTVNPAKRADGEMHEKK